MRLIVAASSVLPSSAALANNSPPAGAGVGAAGAMQLAFSLLLVLAIIFALAYAARRLRVTAPRSSRSMSVLDDIAIGPKERVLLLQVGERQVLLGLSASGLVNLEPLAQNISIAATLPSVPFAERLRSFLKPSASQ